MKKPKWQRAKAITSLPRPYLLGRTMWVLVGEPITKSRTVIGTNKKRTDACYDTNVLGTNGQPAAVSCSAVELLARDEHDFSDEVPFVKWEDWLTESTPEKTT